jgi:hypothetical protein
MVFIAIEIIFIVLPRSYVTTLIFRRLLLPHVDETCAEKRSLLSTKLPFVARRISQMGIIVAIKRFLSIMLRTV